MSARAGAKVRPGRNPPPAVGRKGEPLSNNSDELTQARELGIDTCGRIAEFWGFTRTMGRAFGLLYLSPDPLTQLEIQKRLGISAGSASMTLSALVRWGVAHKVWVRGQRRDHYRAETDFWKMISGVLNERERREISAALDLVTKAETRARSARRNAPATLRADIEFTLQRLERLHELYRMGEVMLDMLLGHMKLDVGRFRAVLKA
jgi:DNA-binding transcriptional regulator GbsR (MarR family)